MFNFGEEKNYLAGVHVDEVGSFLPQSESVKSIFGIYQVILSTLLNPENVTSEVVSTLIQTQTHKDSLPNILLAFIIISPVLALVLSCIDASASS